MTPEQWDRISEIFEKALSLEGTAREAYLKEACAEDPDFRIEVDSLLASHMQAGSQFLNASQELGGNPPEKNPKARVVAGRRIGPYLVEEEVGRGGMGEVFAASRADGQYEKRVALKLVRTGYDTSFILERFRNERQILASLDHPNIARLLDGGTTEEAIPYLVMELVEGAPIDSYCDSHKLSITCRLVLFRQVCSAVQYAHQHLVIHRDIKPSNILVTRDGIPKLLDFGIAKILDASGTTEATMLRPMTPEYASPEQVRGEPISTASDAYSLGVVLYQLLTGRSPYRVTARTPAKLAQAITHDEPERPSTSVQRTETVGENGDLREITPERVSGTREASPLRLQKRLRGDLDFILLKALRKEPAQRYSSVEQFSEDIRRHLEGIPVGARKGTWSYRGGKFIRRHKASVLAAALIFFTLVIAVAITLREARIAQRRFNDVRKLANSLIFEIHDSIVDLPGATKARKLIMERSLEYLDSLAKESGNDPALLRELATAYGRIGILQGSPTDPNLGDTKSALASLQKALQLRESLVRLSPKNSKDQVELAVTYLDFSDFQRGAAGNIASSYEYCKKGLAVLDRELGSSPLDFRILAQSARGYFSLGEIEVGEGAMGQLGSTSSAVADLQTALDRTRRALQVSPNNVILRAHEAGVNGVLGDAMLELGDRTAALANFQQSLEALQSLNTKGDNIRVVANIAVFQIKIGDIYLMDGRNSEALAYYRKGLEIAQQLLDRDPQNEMIRRAVATDYAILAHGLIETGQFPEALRNLQEARARMDSTQSQTPITRTLQGIIHAWIGEVLEHQGKAREAAQEYRKCIELLGAVRAGGTDDVRTQVYFSAAVDHLGAALVKLSEFDNARKQYEQSRILLEPLLKANPEEQEVMYALAETYTREGDLFSKLAELSANPAEKVANWKAAGDSFQKSLGTWSKISHPARISSSGLDVALPDEVSRRLALCESKISSLK